MQFMDSPFLTSGVFYGVNAGDRLPYFVVFSILYLVSTISNGLASGIGPFESYFMAYPIFLHYSRIPYATLEQELFLYREGAWSILLASETLLANAKQRVFPLLSFAFVLLYLFLPFSPIFSTFFWMTATLLFSLGLNYRWGVWAALSGVLLVISQELYPDSPKLLVLIHGTSLLMLFALVQQSHRALHSEHQKNLRTLQILLRSNESQTLDLTEEAVLILNLRGVIEDAFPEACTLLGLPKNALHGKTACKILGIPPLAYPLPSSTQGEFPWNRHNETMTLQYHRRPLLERGVPRGVLLILSDISAERKRFEAYLQAAKFTVIGQVSAGLAHELRNPMTTIKGFMQLITPEQWPSHLRSYHQLILDEIKVTDQILSHFLLLTNPPAPRLDTLDLKKLSVSATQMLHPTALMSEVDFTLDWPNVGPYILGDQDQLLHALLSILQNAIEASPCGATIRLKPAVMKDTVLVTVEDDGPGIPEGIKERVFDPFFTTRREGTGLGLTIAQKIMLAHHGDLLLATPASGQGTRITLTFPRLSEL